VRDFLQDDVIFDPDAVGILLAAFDAAWQSIKTSGARLSDKQTELVRATLAKYIIEQARRGELDERRLSEGALLHLARSNLRYPTGDKALDDHAQQLGRYATHAPRPPAGRM